METIKNSEYKNIMARYNISPTYFYKLRKKANEDVDTLIRLCEEKEERDRNRARRKTEPKAPKKRRSVIKSTNVVGETGVYGKDYPLPKADEFLTSDEYVILAWKYSGKAMENMIKKYYSLRLNYLDERDLAQDMAVKWLKENRKGITLYEDYLQHPEKLKTLDRLVNSSCANHCKDYLKKREYTELKISLESPLRGTENLTVADSVGYIDKDNTSINELVDVCDKVYIRDGVKLSKLVQDVIAGEAFTNVCKAYHVNPNKVRSVLENLGAKEILGSSR